MWFYGNYTFTFINYFLTNIVDDIASTFGTSPWYFYFIKYINYGIIPISIITLFAILLLVFFAPKKMTVWIIIPFLVIHSVVPHKELRFLFPLANLIPLILIQGLQTLLRLDIIKDLNIHSKSIIRFVCGILIAINSMGLVVTMFSPADERGQMNITSYIHDKYFNKQVTLWYIGDTNPYRPIIASQQYYRDNNVAPASFDTTKGVEQFHQGKINLFIVQKEYLLHYPDLLNAINAKLLVNGVPEWIQFLQRKFNYGRQNKSYELYQVDLQN